MWWWHSRLVDDPTASADALGCNGRRSALPRRCALEGARRDRYTTTASAEAVASWNRRLCYHRTASGKCHNAQTPAPRPFTAGQKRGTCSDPIVRRDRRSILSYRHTNNIIHSGRHLHPSVPWVGGDSRATPQPLRRQIQARYRFPNDVHATRRAAARFLKYCCE